MHLTIFLNRGETLRFENVTNLKKRIQIRLYYHLQLFKRIRRTKEKSSL